MHVCSLSIDESNPNVVEFHSAPSMYFSQERDISEVGFQTVYVQDESLYNILRKIPTPLDISVDFRALLPPFYE